MKTNIKSFFVVVYATIIAICNPLNINLIHASDFVFEEKEGFSSSFDDENGAQYTLDNFTGKLLLINLWATWCEPCKEEMPSLDKLQTIFSSDEFLVVPINVDRGPTKNAINFFNEYNIKNIKSYFDDKSSIPREVKILGLPVTLLVNQSGEEIARLIGPADWTHQNILDVIKGKLSN